MKKMLLGVTIAAGLACSAAFANNCLDNLDDHIFGGGTQLDLGACNITDNDMPAVALALGKLPDVTDVFLDDNQIGPDGIQQLAGNHILWLEIHNNNLGPRGAAIVAKFDKLETLCIDNNKIGDEGVIAIANSPTIHQLFITENNVTSVGIKALVQNSAVWNLAVGKNNLDNNALAMLSYSKKLRWLSIEDNNISPEGAEILVSNMMSLELLDICKNPIGNKGMKAIAKKNNLTEIFASNCAIGPEGAMALGEADLPNLYTIDLDGNYVGDQGAAALAKTTRKKFFVALGSNEIMNEGAKALSQSTMIRDLFLPRNFIRDDGAIALAASQTIKFLDVRYNQIGEKGLASLKNGSIRDTETGGNFADDYAKNVKKQSKRNHHYTSHGKFNQKLDSSLIQ